MQFLKVNLWGQELGRLVWNRNTRQTHFMFNPNREDIPDVAPLTAPARFRSLSLPIYGEANPQYNGLPAFIADSLPDSWGNTLFEKWVKDNRIPRNYITPLYKLMFIGKRGMGALEFEPCAEDLNLNQQIDIKSLYNLSLQILEEREDRVLDIKDINLRTLLSVGTSAGGRQMKAIIALNNKTGEIRSGQFDALSDFDYYILKFGDSHWPVAEIEMAYYNMATAAGIEMEESGLLQIEGVNHFLTRRFDRQLGKKIHFQTLAAINPEARSYENLIATCRELNLPESQVQQIFRRMVFNVLANNTDDHNKNFSFLLAENGEWRISPAYDLTFIFNTLGNGPNLVRRLTIRGKLSGISKADILEFAKEMDINNAEEIIDDVVNSIKDVDLHSKECEIGQPWKAIIRKTLRDNLAAFGSVVCGDNPTSISCDNLGRKIQDFNITINSKGYYDLSLMIGGLRHRKVLRPSSPIYHEFSALDIHNLPNDYLTALIPRLFPANS